MSSLDRVEINRKIAMGYRDAYMSKSVEQGERYDAWSFAPDASYSSPYWTGDAKIILSEQPLEAGKTAIMEAKAIALVFPDWTIVDSQIWPSPEGFVIKNRWIGRKHDGSEMGYYSYTFALTNDQNQMTHWETHVNEEFGNFIEQVIGIKGPFDGATYMAAIAAALDKAEVEY